MRKMKGKIEQPNRKRKGRCIANACRLSYRDGSCANRTNSLSMQEHVRGTCPGMAPRLRIPENSIRWQLLCRAEATALQAALVLSQAGPASSDLHWQKPA